MTARSWSGSSSVAISAGPAVGTRDGSLVSALSDYPEFVPVVARWHWEEWGQTDPGGTLAGWTSGLARQAGADQIPGTLVAVADGSLQEPSAWSWATCPGTRR